MGMNTLLSRSPTDKLECFQSIDNSSIRKVIESIAFVRRLERESVLRLIGHIVWKI